MILSDGTDTREEARRPGPYCDGLAVILHLSDFEDEAYGDFTIYGTGRRFGRRVLWCDTQGFMQSETFADENEASHVLRDWAQQYDECDY